MKKAILVATIGAMTLGVNAGDWGKAPVGKAPIEECVDLGGEISVGYATDYYVHGLQVAEDSVWADVNYTFDGLAVPITIGAMYMNGITPVYYDQLDLYATLALGTFAGFETSLGYTHHFFPETSAAEFGEFGLDLRRSLGFADLLLGTNYFVGDGADGWYHTVGLEKSIALTDNISLVLAGGTGYLDGFTAYPSAIQAGSNWNHYYATVSLPIQLNCRTVLTPYVGYFSQDGAHDFDGDDDITDLGEDNIHGGVKLSVSF